jgi:hypothetical protein
LSRSNAFIVTPTAAGVTINPSFTAAFAFDFTSFAAATVTYKVICKRDDF